MSSIVKAFALATAVSAFAAGSAAACMSPKLKTTSEKPPVVQPAPNQSAESPDKK
ncbi:MAG: hypothetical protein AB7G15_02620 [Alphaproteobacteria bacterium]